MKKILLTILPLMVLLTVFSCSKDDIGGTAMQDVAGDWYVTADIVNEDGTVDKDPFGIGKFRLLTYNTADNESDVMWISDQGSFWDFAIKCPVNVAARTFACEDVEAYEGCLVKITDGKILYGAGKQNNGAPADSITMDIQFSDDEEPIVYRIQGIRYSGLVEND